MTILYSIPTLYGYTCGIVSRYTTPAPVVHFSGQNINNDYISTHHKHGGGGSPFIYTHHCCRL